MAGSWPPAHWARKHVYSRMLGMAARTARTSFADAGSPPALRIPSAACFTHCAFVIGVCQGASSRPTRTWPPRDTAASISGRKVVKRGFYPDFSDVLSSSPRSSSKVLLQFVHNDPVCRRSQARSDGALIERLDVLPNGTCEFS